MKFKLVEDVYDKDGYYNPSKDYRYRKLKTMPINKLSKEDMIYLFVIHSTRFEDEFGVHWYTDIDFDDLLERIGNKYNKCFDKAYNHFSSLKFPLKVYRAITDGEDVTIAKKWATSWTTDINLYKDENSIFKNCNKIVTAEIMPNMIQNEYTIVNYIYYSCGESKKYPESEISLKPNAKLDDVQLIDKDDI